MNLDAGEDALGGLDGGVNVGLSVLETSETSLKLRGGEVNTLLEHTPVPLSELGSVGIHGLLEVGHGALAEEETKHARDGGAADVVARGLASLKDAVDELRRDLFEVLVAAIALEDLKSLDAGSHGKGVARKGASLVHWASGGYHLHDLLLATVGANGEATTDDLAHGGDIRGDAEMLLRTAVGDTEASHNLIEDKDGLVLVAQGAEALQELLGGGDEAGVAHNGLEHDGRDALGLVGFEESLNRLEVVVGGSQGACCSALGHTGGVRKAKGDDTGAGGHKEAVGVAFRVGGEGEVGERGEELEVYEERRARGSQIWI